MTEHEEKGLSQRVKSMFVVDYDELEQIDDPCPSCGERLYREEGLFVEVHRCRNCRFEGATTAAPTGEVPIG